MEFELCRFKSTKIVSTMMKLGDMPKTERLFERSIERAELQMEDICTMDVVNTRVEFAVVGTVLDYLAT